MASSRAGDGLQGDGSLLGDGWGLLAQNELLRGGGEVGQTGDGEVFVVEIGVVADEFVGLGIVVSWWDKLMIY